MEIYRRSQFGRSLALIFLVGLLLAAAGTEIAGGEKTRSDVFVTMALLAACFTLTFMDVRVTPSDVKIRFGMGFPGKRVPLAAIVHVEETRIPWYSVGIKRIRRGWAWSVSTGPALDLTLRDGKIVRIGTADPENLLKALQEGTGKTLTSGETER